MTLCVTVGSVVHNVGPWDDQRVEIFNLTDEDIPPNAVIDNGFLVKNPFPEGGVTQDIELAWTALEGGQIVLATDPRAVRPFAPL